MSGQIEALNRWAQWWSTLAVAALWQGALVALAVAAVCYALRHASPGVRYWLWQLVPIKLLVLPLALWTIDLAWLPSDSAPEPAKPPKISLEAALQQVLASREAAEQAAIEELSTAPSPARRVDTAAPAPPATSSIADLSWRSWVMLAWAAIVAAQLARLALLGARLARLLGSATPGDAALVAAVADAAARIGLKRPPRVLVIDRDSSPFVCGLVRPAIVLPRSLVASLADGDLQQVLFHELSHLKRRDLLWGWIPEIARTLYFFHPAVHWAAARIRLERELACDLAAMVYSGRPAADYAQGLVRVLSAGSKGTMFLPAVAPLDGGDSVRLLREETS
jgi:beta-lactamase regulating signal transducer with metallopeptidase domain